MAKGKSGKRKSEKQNNNKAGGGAGRATCSLRAARLRLGGAYIIYIYASHIAHRPAPRIPHATEMPHQVRQGKEARKGADRASPRGLACAAPIHVAWLCTHCGACFNGLWGRCGLPLMGRQRCARAFARHPAAGWRALCTPHIGERARWRGGEAPLEEPRSKLASL
jgi:hypothetical protein